VRVVLLPAAELTGDLDQFVQWTHGLTTAPLGQAYDQNVSFPPVMVYIWGLLAAIEPAFRTATDASDPAIRALMKLPASLADLGLALGMAWALRSRPWWAVAAALGIALHPAVIVVSAWWGQYESLYVLGALVGYLLAVGGRPGWAAVALALAVMTKPQALPLLVPFAAWYLARFGWSGTVRYAAVGSAVIALLWAPFLAFGGPLAYVRNLAEYQDEIFAVLSLRAWNPWWLVQEAYAGGSFVSDSAAIAGPITLRHIGFAVAALLEGVVFLAVYRAPTARALALGLAAAALVAFCALTTMHERYAYAALVFLALLLPDRRVLAVWVVFGVTFALNLLAAAPPTPEIGRALPIGGLLGVVGSVAMTAVSAATLWLLLQDRRPPDDATGQPRRLPEGRPAGG
jgi:dolichyl-phosphate-mannose-protein mannosyltransferase